MGKERVSPKVAKGGRMDFLDALRGIAACSVLLEHVGERTSPSLLYFFSNYFQMGQFGVTLFFLTSGFIIPVSLERLNSLRSFWLRRIFRLYPLYLLTMVLAIVLAARGIYTMMPGSMHSRPMFTVITNLAMLQEFLGAGNIEPLYWTLNFEMAFYIMVSLLFRLKLLKYSVLLASLWMLVATVAGFVLPRLLHAEADNGLFFDFGTMFVGTLIYRLYTASVSIRQVGAVVGLALVAILVINYSYFWGAAQPEFLGTRTFLPMLTAWTLAYVLFLLGFSLRTRKTPMFLKYLGRISYSVYLLQALIIDIVPDFSKGLYTGVSWIVITLACATFTYRYVEKPCIELARRPGLISLLKAESVSAG